jgi:phosphatidylserine/phosphatidylglycerophosphate/cardiolipin synthase-like enzyme
MLGDLHAKLYVVETSRRARVFMGSANATERAFNGNVEILCELTGGATRLGIDAMLGDKSPLRGILEVYRFPETPSIDTAQVANDIDGIKNR